MTILKTTPDSTESAPAYPLAAILGMAAAKRALMLLRIDRGLKGVLIESSDGSALTILSRALQTLSSDRSNEPFIEVPLSVSEERLLGSLDFERALLTGERTLQPGLLAAADCGVLCIRDINLLDDRLSSHIAAALDSGILRVEREGISATSPARFVLTGTLDSDAGGANKHLRERVGLLIKCESGYSTEGAAEATERSLRFDLDPQGLIDEYSIETAALRSAVEEARLRLPQVPASREALQRIAETAIALGVEGNYADVFAVRAARANAALEGRQEVADDDIVTAIRLVLLPRATRMPVDQSAREELASTAHCDSTQPSAPVRADDTVGNLDAPRASRAEELMPAEELLIAALDTQPPDGALSFSTRSRARPLSGRRAAAGSSTRGRHIRSALTRADRAPVAVAATLRAAAPFQLVRTAGDASHGRRVRLRLRPDDLRFKEFKRRTGALFIFAVDASGSMALNRMAQAKGALTRLLQKAYLHRDKVALISFRHSKAEVLLPPTPSVELAKRLVDEMPSGGATPVAAALIKALELSRLARLQGLAEAVLLLFTDGRANVGLRHARPRDARAGIQDELRQLGLVLRLEGVKSAVIDTRSRFISGGEGQALAELLGAGYFYLPRADISAIHEAVTSIRGNAF